jgi:hypothetical protein
MSEVPPNPYANNDPTTGSTPAPPPGGGGYGAQGYGSDAPGYSPPGYGSDAPGYGAPATPPAPGYGSGAPGYTPAGVPDQTFVYPAQGSVPPGYPPGGGYQGQYSPQGQYGQPGYQVPGEKKGKGGLIAVICVAALVFVAGLGVGGYFLFKKDGTPEASTTTTISFRPSSGEPTQSRGSSGTPGPTSTAGQGIPGGYTLNQHIALGTCYDKYSQKSDLADAHVVDCSVPHAMEVVKTFEWTSNVTTQDDPAIESAGRACWQYIGPLLGGQGTQLWNDSNADLWYPSNTQVNRGETTGYCMLVPEVEDAQIVGSLTAGNYQGQF